MRSLFQQQKTLAANKLQCTAQIKRTSTPDPPSNMSNVPPRQARARSEKASGVTSSSSEDSDNEPQTASKAQFMVLKRCFETQAKSKEDTPSHSVVKRQRLFCTPFTQSANSFPPASNASALSQGR